MAIQMHAIDAIPPTFNPSLLEAQLTCPPSTIHIDTLISTFLRYFDRNKTGMGKFPAHYGVLMAMKATWPCNRR
jgi:hypothetical protein